MPNQQNLRTSSYARAFLESLEKSFLKFRGPGDSEKGQLAAHPDNWKDKHAIASSCFLRDSIQFELLRSQAQSHDGGCL